MLFFFIWFRFGWCVKVYWWWQLVITRYWSGSRSLRYRSMWIQPNLWSQSHILWSLLLWSSLWRVIKEESLALGELIEVCPLKLCEGISSSDWDQKVPKAEACAEVAVVEDELVAYSWTLMSRSVLFECIPFIHGRHLKLVEEHKEDQE